jgi:hypothetical protein
MNKLVPFQPEMAQSEIIVNDIFLIFLRKDGIIQIQIADNAEIDEEEVIYFHEIIVKLSNGRKHPILAIYQQFNTFTEEALNLIANNDLTSADALVSQGSFVLTAFYNYYQHYSVPKRPTQKFDNVEDAIEWLKGYL